MSPPPTRRRIAGLVAAVSLAGPVVASAGTLSVSMSPDRTGSTPLDGRTLSGAVYVHFPGTDAEIRQVQFYLDIESAPAPVRRDGRAPFDLVGSRRARPGEPARPFDTSSLPDGEHVLHALVRDGSVRKLYAARFTVANRDAGTGADAPAPVVATATVEPLPPAPLATVVVEPAAPDRAATDAGDGAPPDAAAEGGLEALVPASGESIRADGAPTGGDPLTPVPTDASAKDPGAEGDVAALDATDPAIPGARFTVTCEGLTCTFDASPSVGDDATLKDWSWRFGDGTVVGASPVVRHVFDAPGPWPVALTVWDEYCDRLDTDAVLLIEGDRDWEALLPAERDA